MPVIWLGEAYDYPPDPVSGCRKVRLTSAALHHVNVYCEHAYCSPDGRRIAILRSPYADPRMPPFDLLAADLYSLRITTLERDVESVLVASASWSGILFYLKSGALWKVDLTTLEKEVAWPEWDFDPDLILHTVSPDSRYLVAQLQQAHFVTALVRLDLNQRTSEVIYEDPEISNAHPLFNPIHGRDISLMKAGRYAVNDRQEVREIPDSPRVVTHFYIDADGGNKRMLPVGEPWSANSCGHTNWVGDTGRLAYVSSFNQTDWTLDPRHPEGNLFTAAPGDEAPRVFTAPEHRFNHIATSRCGRFFVGESYPEGIPGRMPLVVGCFETGKYRELLGNCGAGGGCAAASHPHAYFTTDNKHVVFNADPYLIGHVHAARIPEGFLESLL